MKISVVQHNPQDDLEKSLQSCLKSSAARRTKPLTS